MELLEQESAYWRELESTYKSSSNLAEVANLLNMSEDQLSKFISFLPKIYHAVVNLEDDGPFYEFLAGFTSSDLETMQKAAEVLMLPHEQVISKIILQRTVRAVKYAEPKLIVAAGNFEVFKYCFHRIYEWEIDAYLACVKQNKLRLLEKIRSIDQRLLLAIIARHGNLAQAKAVISWQRESEPKPRLNPFYILMNALRSSNFEIFEYIVEQFGDKWVNDQLFSVTVRYGLMDSVKYLMEKYSDRFPNFENYLITAKMFGHTELVELFKVRS